MIISRIINGLEKLCFLLIFAKKFYIFGNKSCIKRPFRIDGAENIIIGNNTFIQKDSWLYAVGIEGIAARLTIGMKCVFGYNNHITCVRVVSIGDKVLTANNVYISDNLHSYENINTPVLDQAIAFKGSVSIGSGSWLGENVCIIGASIGKNCVIGANSVVTKDIPDYCVAVGAPAKIIKRYDLVTDKWVKCASVTIGRANE